MNIGIDISSVVNQKTGVARYTKQLVKNLLEIDKENRYTLYSFFGSRKNTLPFNKNNAIFKAYNYPPQSFKTFLLMLRLLNKSPDFLTKEADIMHSTDLLFPASSNKPSVLTVHDLIFLRFPRFYTQKNRSYMKSMAKFSIKNASHIICYSQATKKDIVNLLAVDENKISVIYLGVEKYFKRTNNRSISLAKQKYKLPRNYILTLSTIEPRKNLKRLIQAFNSIKSEIGDFKLVIVGQRGWKYRKFFQFLSQMDVEEDIVLTGYVNDKDLPAIYSGASVFAYPSLYEGFGLPVLEAMACGTPVVCANTSSLPEIVGEAAVTINPYSVKEIATGIKNVIVDKNLAKTLSNESIKQARKFSWENTAKQTLAIYKQVAEK